nr:MAG TPA: hypothetical protein [Caudoviricetes sp.]
MSSELSAGTKTFKINVCLNFKTLEFKKLNV